MGGGINFTPDKDIPDLSGKVILVTGGTAGLGKESVLALAKHNPSRIYFTGRNATSAASVIDEIQAAAPSVTATFLECDLGSLSTVEAAAKKLTAESARLDVLMCNAGVAALPPGLTKDGFEIQFGTNHLGHALFLKLLLPLLRKTAEQADADVRIVILASMGFAGHPAGGIVFDQLRTTQGQAIIGAWVRYGQSKLANILYAAELARRYPTITSVSIHPGVVQTGMVSSMAFWNKALVYITNPVSMRSPAEGAYNQLWAAAGDKSGIVNGEFYEPIAKPGAHARESKNEKLAAELWDWSQKELEGYDL